MSNRFRVAGGKCAIWTDASNTAPFDNPLGNLSRVKFHSDLSYINVIQEINVTLNLAEITGKTASNKTEHTASHTLFAHGRGGFPFVLGKITVGGQPVAFTGSVPVQLGDTYITGMEGPYGRWLSLGADETNVYIYEYAVLYYSNSDYNMTYPALSLPVTVWVTNELL